MVGNIPWRDIKAHIYNDFEQSTTYESEDWFIDLTDDEDALFHRLKDAQELRFSAPVAECVDTDNGSVDSYGDPCSGYTDSPDWCNSYDDDDFISSSMCCACGGGEGSVEGCTDIDNGAGDVDGDSCSDYQTSYCGGYDDDDFISNEMCCICGGGDGEAAEV